MVFKRILLQNIIELRRFWTKGEFAPVTNSDTAAEGEVCPEASLLL
jgi:hypothetical protein